MIHWILLILRKFIVNDVGIIGASRGRSAPIGGAKKGESEKRKGKKRRKREGEEKEKEGEGERYEEAKTWIKWEVGKKWKKRRKFAGNYIKVKFSPALRARIICLRRYHVQEDEMALKISRFEVNSSSFHYTVPINKKFTIFKMS